MQLRTTRFCSFQSQRNKNVVAIKYKFKICFFKNGKNKNFWFHFCLKTVLNLGCKFARIQRSELQYSVRKSSGFCKLQYQIHHQDNAFHLDHKSRFSTPHHKPHVHDKCTIEGKILVRENPCQIDLQFLRTRVLLGSLQ